MPDVLVVNASPLIFLANVGRLDLLRAIGAPRVVVPDAVYDEVTDARHADAVARALSAAPWVERFAPIAVPTSVIEWDLGPGESAVIAAGLQIARCRVVIDDLNGRKCSLALGVDVMGTLGVVIAAYRRGQIADPRQLLLEMRASGMWLADSVIERALRLAGVDPDPTPPAGF